ncbi:MAG: DGQHR domain-containing protein [Sedimentisphaerales bacterium]|nr:DGQHR domain-containing protein [Sedimentisphaerales bacterium]
MNETEARKRIKQLTDPRIDEVALLFLGFGMELIECDDATKVERGGETIGHIDLIFKSQELKKYFFIEVSEQEDERALKINGFFRRWEDSRNRGVIEKRFNILSNYKIIYIYFDLSKKENIPESVVQNINQYVINNIDFEYFSESYKMIGKWSRNDFLSFLDIKPQNRSNITKSAIQFFLGNIRAYMYVDSAKDLLEYCYVYRRRGEHIGYQRIIHKQKIDDISKKIHEPDFLAFPNTILLSCPDNSQICNQQKEKSACPCPVEINIPNYFCACRIIDGQHRILGFSKLSDTEQETHHIPIIVLENIETDEEIKTFIEINTGQKKIDRNLILVLRAGFNWDFEKKPKEFFEKQIVEVIQRLNNTQGSPLKESVFIPSITATRKGKITLNTLVYAIKGNNLIGGKLRLYQNSHNDTETPYKKIKELFILLKTKLQQYSRDSNSFLLTNKGLRILFRLVQVYERNRIKKNISFKLGTLFTDIEKIFDDKFITQLDKLYGEGGANEAVKLILNKVKNANKEKYINLTTDLRKV